jgi:hypothetical protein
MTDLEKFIDTYAQFGIVVKAVVNKDGNTQIFLNECSDRGTESEKFDGFSGFISDIEFDKNGKFLRQGFWE